MTRTRRKQAQKVSEEAITRVLAEVAPHLGEAQFISGHVDRLSAAQPAVLQYVVAHKADLSVSEIVQLLFQVAVVQRIIGTAMGHKPGSVQYADLDAAANSTPGLEQLAEDEPDLASYIFSNLDMESGERANKIAGEVLAHVSRAMLEVSPHAVPARGRRR